MSEAQAVLAQESYVATPINRKRVWQSGRAGIRDAKRSGLMRGLEPQMAHGSM
jgi:hypothetical protein